MSFVVTPPSAPPDAAIKSPPSPCRREISLNLRPKPGESLPQFFARMAAELRGATILHLLVFGSTKASADAVAAMQSHGGKIDFPITWVEGAACDGGSIAGIQAAAWTGGPVQRIRLKNRVVGSVFEEGGARHCLLGDLRPKTISGSPADQTRQAIGELDTALALAGFSLGDTVRTWFFLENILSWYDQFNSARTQVYSGVPFRAGSHPASTGVGACNPAGAAVALAARAMKPLDSRARAAEMASPLQCPAPAYGSSFSRAMELTTATTRRLLISGTASIAPAGETLWRNDIERQVALTMDVVEAILHARGFSLRDLTRAVAYFKHPADAYAFRIWCNARGLLSHPVLLARCDICRDDLLFELEADACQSALSNIEKAPKPRTE